MKTLNGDIDMIYTTCLIKSSELRIKKQKQISKESAIHWLKITESKWQWHKTRITAPLLQVTEPIIS